MTLSRRGFLEFAIGGAALATTSEIYSSQRTGAVALDASGAIDRKALVVRHSPVLQKFDPLSPLSIGNGEFAFIAFGLLGQPMEFRSEPASIIPAFPGAEGFGAATPGGRGGKVITVTNLSDNGPGNFRAAREAEGHASLSFARPV